MGREGSAAAPAKVGRGRPRKTGSESVGIQSVEVALEILAKMVSYQEGINLSELSRSTGVPPSKLHRYLVSFTRHGLLRQSPTTGQYDFGPFARRIGAAAFNRHNGVNVVSEAMTRISSQSGCTVCLYIWTELGPTLIRVEVGRYPMHVNLREGTALPVAGSATGRVFLAYLPPSLTAELVRAERRQVPGEGFRAWSDEELAAEFAVIRSQPVYWTTNAILPGALALAPIFDAGRQLHSVLAVVPPRGQSTADKKRLLAVIEAHVQRLGEELS